MRLTPIEISQHKFSSRLRGLDRDEVEAFLATVVSDFEEIVRENAQLRREAERLARDLDTHRSREKTIQETLTTAQGLVDQMHRAAAKDAEQVVVEAELQSERLLMEARERRADLSREIAELAHVRQRLEADLRSAINGYLRLIDAFGVGETQATAQPANGQPRTRAPRGSAAGSGDR